MNIMRLCLIFVVLTLFTGCAGGPPLQVSGPIVPEKGVGKIRFGMAPDQVVSVLGPPHEDGSQEEQTSY